MLLFDGANIAHRANAVLDLDLKGESISAVYGTLMSIQHAVRKLGSQRLVFAWEGARSRSARRRIYPEYKANREPTEESVKKREQLTWQMGMVKKLLHTLGVTQICIPEMEADDVIANLTGAVPGKKIIVSGDRDFVQLISPDVELFYLTKKRLVGVNDIGGMFGVHTGTQFLNLRIIMGDKSDNIPGIKGAGEKTALKMLAEPANPKYAAKLAANKDVLMRNRKLMDLTPKEAGIKQVLQHFRDIPPNFTEFRSLLVKYRFSSLLRNQEYWVTLFRGCNACSCKNSAFKDSARL